MTSQFPDGTLVTLASVLNEFENNFLLASMGGDAANRNPPDYIWLGLDDGQTLKWSDGHHFDYSHWGVGRSLRKYNTRISHFI